MDTVIRISLSCANQLARVIVWIVVARASYERW